MATASSSVEVLCRDVQGQHTIAESMNGVGPLRLCAEEATPEDLESRKREIARLLSSAASLYSPSLSSTDSV